MHQRALHTIESVLEELEVLAGRTTSQTEFLRDALQRLQDAAGADAVFIATQIQERRWMVRGGCGTLADETQKQILDVFNQSGDKIPSETKGQLEKSPAWYSFAISNIRDSLGQIVFVFHDTLTEPARRGLQELAKAFSEVLIARHAGAIAEFFHSDWKVAQRALAKLSSAATEDQCYATLVNELATIFHGARVSVFKQRTGRCAVKAISGVSNFDMKSSVIETLVNTASSVFHDQRPVVCQSSDSQLGTSVSRKNEGSLANYAFLPIVVRGTNQARWVIGLEFPDRESLGTAMDRLPELVPAFGIVMEQRIDWLTLPAVIRGLSRQTDSPKWLTRPVVKYALVALAMSIVAFLLLRPQTLVIDAEGTLTPSEVKMVFVSADGYITELLVAENEQVNANQVLARMRSPGLELQTEELQGQLRSLDEESRGLEISINQPKSSGGDQLSEQSIIASKLSDIRIQRESISEQLKILGEQSAELEIRSPIQGVVAGRELRQNLQGRPVSRGDALFKILNLESSWEVRVRVPDRDSGYVNKTFSESADAEKTIQFVLDGLPYIKYQAEVMSIANQVESVHTDGTYVLVRATVSGVHESKLRAGSSVHAYFECGTQPAWFVWTRPFIESLQRRLWL